MYDAPYQDTKYSDISEHFDRQWEDKKRSLNDKADNSSIICRDLLNLRIKSKDNPTPSERTDEYYKARPCSELCRYAADLLEQFLAENKKV